MVPQHPVLRIAAMVWLVAVLAILAFMLLRPDESRVLSSLVPLYFMSLPLGHAGLLAVSKLKLELYLGYEFVPGIFTEGVLLWAMLALLGYAQWFLLLPLTSRGIRQLGDAYAAWRVSAK